MLAIQNFTETAHGVTSLHVFTIQAMEFLSHKHRLTQETLNFTGAGNQHLVIFAQFVNTKNGDDVLQVVVFLQNLLHFAGGTIMLFTNNVGLQRTAG